MKNATSDFGNELEKRNQDLKATRKEIKRLNDAVDEAIAAGDDTDSLDKELMRQWTIAVEHNKHINKIDTDERKIAIKHCLHRRTYVIQTFDEEAGQVCDNVGLMDATERLKKLERSPLSVDMSPAVFREDVWDTKEVEEGVAIRKLKDGQTILRFNPVITSGVFTFTAKLTGLDGNGYGYAHLGCVSKLEADRNSKQKILGILPVVT